LVIESWDLVFANEGGTTVFRPSPFFGEAVFFVSTAMTDFTVISRFRNKERVQALVAELRKRGKTCYDFCEIPADPKNPERSPEEQMAIHEATENFYTDPHFIEMFRCDLDGLKNAEKVIMLLPCGNAAHIEAGIAYGLGKHLILIGEPEKPETLYLIFEERYLDEEEFLKSLHSV